MVCEVYLIQTRRIYEIFYLYIKTCISEKQSNYSGQCIMYNVCIIMYNYV